MMFSMELEQANKTGQAKSFTLDIVYCRFVFITINRGSSEIWELPMYCPNKPCCIASYLYSYDINDIGYIDITYVYMYVYTIPTYV